MSKSRPDKTSGRYGAMAEIGRSEGIISHDLPSTEAVERRAQELALIAGRKPHDVMISDRIQAKKELLGSKPANAPADESDIIGGGLGAPPISMGRQKGKASTAGRQMRDGGR